MIHAAVLLNLALLATPAAPPSDTELEGRYQDAVLALQENHPEVALGLFEWVLATVPTTHLLRPLSLYGAARAASAATAAGHACAGATRTREYLALDAAEPAKRDRLSRALPELEARCAAETAPPPVAATPAPESAGPAHVEASAALDARLTAPVVEPGEAQDALRTAGWLSVATGAALAAVGGYCWYAATRAQDDAAAATTIARHGERVDAMETTGGWALGLSIAGGLGLVGGTGMLLFGESK